VRAAFRLIGEVRERASDPAQWRPHMVRRLRRLLDAEIVISSEVHIQAAPPPRPGGGQLHAGAGNWARAANGPKKAAGAPAEPPTMRIVDVGWGCDGANGHVWQIHRECDAPPEAYMLALLPKPADSADANPAGPASPIDPDAPLPVRPTVPVHGGKTFILSQYPLPHLGAVDQLGVHRGFGQTPFTAAQHRLVRLFHVELGRLWKKDALKQVRDPNSELPPRLAQTLAALQAGCSEKEVSNRLGISPHTVHNYVKALHQRFGVTSRGELLAKMPRPGGFLPKFSVERAAPAGGDSA
jgi:hypothetical protein